MLRHIIITVVLSGWHIALSGQEFDILQVNDVFSDKELIEDIFLKGFCSNVSNIETIGEDFSVGHFFNGDNIIGIDEGVIISCGNIRSASGPNINTETTTIIGTTGDKDLSIIATSPVFDASGISFDFVPLSNRVSFNYVFASEEYCEFVGTAFNDVFGFFVSGPGISGDFSDDAVNVALIPGSDEFVSINSINHNSNADLYIRNELEADATRCAISFEPRFSENIEFDGFTIPMKAAFNVIPCETYTIRLVVADVNDEKFDSAVFLEMNSFDIGGNIRITAANEVSSDTLVSEGCTDGLFIVERVLTDSGNDVSYDLAIDPSSTASLGTDIEPFPLTINFLPGETRKEIPIRVLDDNLSEGQETFSIRESSQCPCSDTNNATLLISDADFFSAEFDAYEACEDQSFSIEPIIIGGAPPYTYVWSDGSMGEELTTQINTTTNFDLLVMDFCGRQVSASTAVNIKEVPVASTAGEYLLCEGVEQFVEVSFEGTPPWELVYQLDNAPPITEENILVQPFIIPVAVEGNLNLLAFRDRTCEGLVMGFANIIRQELEIELFLTSPTCQNTFDGEIAFDIISDDAASTIRWTPEVNDELEPRKLQGGVYRLEITDERGCIYDEDIELIGENNDADDCSDLNIYIPNVYSPNDDDNEDDYIIHLEHEPQITSVRSFIIYDRWGNRIYEKLNFPTTENNLEFSANLNTQDLIPMVLAYVATFNMFDGTSRSVSGTIMVIR